MKKKQISIESHVESIMAKIDFVVEDIKAIKIQGATNIARAGFRVLREEILSTDFVNKDEFFIFLKEAIRHLTHARSTEPMLKNGMHYALWISKRMENKPLSVIIQAVDDGLQEMLDLIYVGDKERSNIAKKLISSGSCVMTHCHSGSVLKVLKQAWQDGRKFEVVNTEARPLYQGRITSQELVDAGIPTTLITDDMGPYYIDQTVSHMPKIDMLFLGCDVIKPNGDIINKVGSFALALSAWHSGIPVYIVGSLMKYDFGDTVSIELRDGSEIWPMAPKDLKILNFAFDTVPAEFITGIVTRDGVVKSKDISRIVSKKYPWLGS